MFSTLPKEPVKAGLGTTVGGGWRCWSHSLAPGDRFPQVQGLGGNTKNATTHTFGGAMQVVVCTENTHFNYKLHTT